MAIMFGSPEANAIRERDKELEYRASQTEYYIVFEAKYGGSPNEEKFDSQDDAEAEAMDMSAGMSVYVVAITTDDRDDYDIISLFYDGQEFTP